MSVTGFLVLLIVACVLGYGGGLVGATIMSARRRKPDRAEFARWHRLYAIRIGAGLVALVIGSRYAIWFGRSWDSGNHTLRGHAILSVAIIAVLAGAAIFGVRQLRAAKTVTSDPGQAITPPDPQWWIISCRHGHSVYVQDGAPGAYCQIDGDWVQLPVNV